MDKFLMTVKWRGSEYQDRPQTLRNLTILGIMEKLENIHQTAGASLVEQIVILPENIQIPIGSNFVMDLDGNVKLAS